MKASEIRDLYVGGLHLIPDHMHGGVSRYMERGVEPGTFLFSMLRGETERAWLSADLANRLLNEEWAEFLRNYLVPVCHGSPLKTQAWMAMRGLSNMPPDGK